jgi:hypothetical protein
MFVVLVSAITTSPRMGHAMSDGLVLEVRCDRSVLKRNDPVLLEGTVRNTSAGPVTFLTRVSPHGTSHVVMRNRLGERLQQFRLISGLPSPYDRNDFVVIPPSGQWKTTIRAQVREMTFRDPEKNGHPWVSGLFLDFQNSAIRIPGPGEYDLTMEFQRDEAFLRELEQSVGIQNAWFGHLVSAPVRIEIKSLLSQR